MAKQNINDFMLKYWEGDEVSTKPLHECDWNTTEEAEMDVNSAMIDNLQEELSRGIESGDFEAEDFDPDRLFHRGLFKQCPEVLEAWNTAPSKTDGYKALLENAAAQIRGSGFDQFFDRCQITRFVQSACSPAEFTTASCFSQQNVPCSNRDLSRTCEILDPIIEPCFKPEFEYGDNPVRWLNDGTLRCWKWPKLQVSRVGFSWGRSLRCYGNARTEITERMDRAIRQGYGLADERARLDLMFGMDGATGLTGGSGCQVQYHYDDVTYNTGYLTDPNGPWCNTVCGPEWQLRVCNEHALCAFEEIWESIVDPHTCQEIVCPGDFTVFVTRQCKIRDFRDMISPMQRRSAGNTDRNGCALETVLEHPARDGWGEVKYSQHLYNRLVDFYMNNQFECLDAAGVVQTHGPAADEETARMWATNTYLVSKNFQDTFAWLVDFAIQTYERNTEQSEAYIEHGIIFRRIYEYMRGTGWQRPWNTILVRAFDPTVNPIP